MKRKIILSIFSLLLFLKTDAQCAMCRAVLESGEDQSTAEGINDGIMFLMAMPYILVAVIGIFIYRKYGGSQKIENTDEIL